MRTPAVHVMVGVLRDSPGRILINQRPAGKVQAGRWEFPGGKLESGEAPEAGLRRELREELGIVAGPMHRLLEIRYDYSAFSVQLDVREILHFGGSPSPKESQALKWVLPDDLPCEDILEADHAIVQALRMPDCCLITPDPATMTRTAFFSGLKASLDAGISLLQLRAKSLSMREYRGLAREVLAICRDRNARLLLNAPVDVLQDIAADGIHLDGARLRASNVRPVPPSTWLSAACHNLHDLECARQLRVDFALLSPVRATQTHPGETGIGWAGFRKLASAAAMPVYALGGLSPADVQQARSCGGRGIAAIRGLWRGDVNSL